MTAIVQHATDRTPCAHALPVDAVLQQLGSGPNGLSAVEAERRLAEDGPNVIPEPPLPSAWAVFLRQFLSPFIYVLMFAGGLSAYLGEWSDATFIGAVLVLNAVIGGFQENRAQHSAAALRRLVPAHARVLRDGDVVELDAMDLVRGDVLLLASGDRVPADVRLLDAPALRCDESLLTGESKAVAKEAATVLEATTGLADRLNMAHAGTLVTFGRGTGVVVATGAGTTVGRLAGDLARPVEADPPLLVRMRQFTLGVSVVIALVAVGLGAIEAGRGTPLHEVALMAIALSVAAIPEGLPVALTVALAIGMTRMARRRVVVRRLLAVESLGSCTVIASDKTGTLTLNELTATRITLPGEPAWEVTGAGTEPYGELLLPGGEDVRHLTLVDRLALATVLCNEAVLAHTEGGWTHHGDAVDVALLVLAHKVGVTRTQALRARPQVAAIPFESERRYAATRHSGPDGDEVMVKGAIERVLSMCTWEATAEGDRPLDVVEALAAADRLTAMGCRVIAVAGGPYRGTADRAELAEEDLRELTFLGLVGMMDPPRPAAATAVADCHGAGIEVVMVTGDHPDTALEIARAVGMAEDRGQVVTGQQLRAAEEAGEHAVDALVAEAKVFARVEPAQKLTIVQALIRAGHVVAVTGDGANDAPALRQAHVGVAMGRSGTDVAREAAELILTDDDFSSVAAGVEEGRIAYANVRKVIQLLVATGAGEVVLFLLALGTGLPIPLLAVQLLWLNLVTNGIQDVALAFEPGEGDEMKHPPRPPAEPIFNRLMVERVLLVALVIGWCRLRRVPRAAGPRVDDAGGTQRGHAADGPVRERHGVQRAVGDPVRVPRAPATQPAAHRGHRARARRARDRDVPAVHAVRPRPGGVGPGRVGGAGRSRAAPARRGGGAQGAVAGDRRASPPARAREEQAMTDRTTSSRHIVVGVDGSYSAREALRWAVRQAALDGARVTAVIAWNLVPPDGFGDLAGVQDDTVLEQACRRDLEAVVRRVAGDYPVTAEVRQGTAADVLADMSQDADLLVVGAHGRGRLAAALRGSVSQATVRHAACPVVVVRTGTSGVLLDGESATPA